MAGYSVTMPNTYVSLPGFDVDAEDVEEQKVQNAMARLDFINGELAGRIHMKHFNCHEGALPFTKTYLLRPLFNTFLMSPKPFYATDACIACKKCEKVCPVHNIEVTDKPNGAITAPNVWDAIIFVLCTRCNMVRQHVLKGNIKDS